VCAFITQLYLVAKKATGIQKAALASGQQLIAEVDDKQHRDVGYVPATVQCGKQ